MRWQAWRLNRADALRLGRLRHRPELEVCEAEDCVWLRTADLPDELQAELAGLPATQFSVLADGQLIERGRQVPHGNLPEEGWSRIANWMRVDIGVPAIGAKPTRVAPRWVRSAEVQNPRVLLARFADWHAWTVAAPQVRLNRLAFAASDGGWVLIRGEPLPPIRGVRFVEQRGVAIEAGWTWRPGIAAEVMAVAMEITPGDLALIHADGSWDHLRHEDFVQASRAAVRQSAEELASG